MMRYKLMSARKFLNNLTSMVEDGYNGKMCDIYISEHFLKKIRKEVCRTNSDFPHLHIFCGNLHFSPSLHKDPGLYFLDCGKYFKLMMCHPFNPDDDKVFVCSTINTNTIYFL